MKFTSLSISGFRSFSATQTVSLADGHGLYQLAGRNDVEHDLGANGAGKSTLFEALYWCLYGRTSRGLKAGNVQCWLPNSPRCSVSLRFENATDTYDLTRTWNPNALTLAEELDGGIVGLNAFSTRPIDQTELERLVGIGPEAFLQCVYHAQFSPSFVDLPPADRLALLSEVLALDKWEAAATAASNLARELEGQRVALQTSIARLEGAAAQLAAQDWPEKMREWEAESEARSIQLENVLSDTQHEKKKAYNELVLAKAPLIGFQPVDIKPALEQAVVDAAHELRIASQKLAVAQSELKQAEQRQARVALGIIGVPCSQCGQPLTAEHRAAERARCAASVKERSDASEPLQLAVDQAADMLEAAKNRLAGTRRLDAEMQARELARAKTIAAAETKHQVLAVKVVTVANEMAEAKRAVNPHADGAAKAATELASIKEELLPPRCADLADVARLITGASYWTRGFRELRLYIVQRVLLQLDVAANNALVQLGLPDWSVAFSVEQETKAGTLRRGFSILVRAPHSGEEPVPFEAWSGGEGQRLRLAISMGLSDLISEQLGFTCNLELWDEPSTWLSESGISELLDVLTERARRSGKALWLADHRSLDYGGFAGGLTAVKWVDGTRLEGIGLKINPLILKEEKTGKTAENADLSAPYIPRKGQGRIAPRPRAKSPA